MSGLRLREGKACAWDAQWSSFPFLFPNTPFPAHLVLCSPFIRNSQVNFINVGVEQMLKAIQDFVFVFNFVVPSLPSPSHA